MRSNVALPSSHDDQGMTTGSSSSASSSASLSGAAHLDNKRRKSILSKAEENKKFLTYPMKRVKKEGKVDLCNADLGRLDEGNYLNDSVIDFYFRFVR